MRDRAPGCWWPIGRRRVSDLGERIADYPNGNWSTVVAARAAIPPKFAPIRTVGQRLALRQLERRRGTPHQSSTRARARRQRSKPRKPRSASQSILPLRTTRPLRDELSVHQIGRRPRVLAPPCRAPVPPPAHAPEIELLHQASDPLCRDPYSPFLQVLMDARSPVRAVRAGLRRAHQRLELVIATLPRGRQTRNHA